MKANAPEKLYVNSNDHLTYNGYYAFTNKMRVCDTEYTRTDAFMKKAENFLEMLWYGFTITDNITHKNYDKEQLIADFRSYMEE